MDLDLSTMTIAARRPPGPALNADQQSALDLIMKWLASPDQFFLLEGYAGTGKTFTVKKLIDRYSEQTAFTAPTNKATRVLRDSVSDEDYRPYCGTIYSLLGLKLEASGEVKQIKMPEKAPSLGNIRLIVVDEAMMLNKQVFTYICRMAAAHPRTHWLFMGDSAQLPPVGEKDPPVLALRASQWHVQLTKVERHDNQILTLATYLRERVDAKTSLELKNDFRIWIAEDDVKVWEGVRRPDPREVKALIELYARAGKFSQQTNAKAIAWRNVTVDALNVMIRGQIFPQAYETFWLPGDRIILTSPAKNLDGDTIATTDEEGTLETALVERHPNYPEYAVWKLSVVCDFAGPQTFYALHASSAVAHQREKERLATHAKMDGRQWKKFWEFEDDFHKVRHGYAITAHRAQGSTYTTAFVDYRDILQNKDMAEGRRCLYVACTRPKSQLILG